MRDFRRNNRFGNRGGRMMHQTTCDKCGRACEVPFQPTGEKPVYCNECFAATGGREERSGRGQGRDMSRDFAVINEKLDRIMAHLGISSQPVTSNHASPVDTMEANDVMDEALMADDFISKEE